METVLVGRLGRVRMSVCTNVCVCVVGWVGGCVCVCVIVCVCAPTRHRSSFEFQRRWLESNDGGPHRHH